MRLPPKVILIYMFGRRSQPESEVAPSAPAEEDTDLNPAQAKKGRPTPSRKEAEATRKTRLKAPADNKAAKKEMKAREREERMKARQGMMAGDERYFPARDQGPGKAYTRDYVDSRRRLSEYFLFIAVGILLAGFVQSPQAKNIVSLLWFLVAGLVVLDVTWFLITFSRRLKAEFPDPADRKGCKLYAAMRLLQIRRLRIPPPRLRPGGKPVEPKKPKEPQS